MSNGLNNRPVDPMAGIKEATKRLEEAMKDHDENLARIKIVGSVDTTGHTRRLVVGAHLNLQKAMLDSLMETFMGAKGG